MSLYPLRVLCTLALVFGSLAAMGASMPNARFLDPATHAAR